MHDYINILNKKNHALPFMLHEVALIPLILTLKAELNGCVIKLKLIVISYILLCFCIGRRLSTESTQK